MKYALMKKCCPNTHTHTHIYIYIYIYIIHFCKYKWRNSEQEKALQAGSTEKIALVPRGSTMKCTKTPCPW